MGRATRRLRSLVEDVLDFSVIEAGRLTLDDRPFDLHRVLDDLLDTYRPVVAAAGLRWSGTVTRTCRPTSWATRCACSRWWATCSTTP